MVKRRSSKRFHKTASKPSKSEFYKLGKAFKPSFKRGGTRS